MEFESIIKTKRSFDCQHNKYLIDNRLNIVECGICGKELNPMFVLEQLCYQETRYMRNLERLQELAEKAKAKNRCKCEKCGKFTTIQKSR